MTDSFRDLFVPTEDGLRLYARDYGPEAGAALPVVCLPGLARTSADFHDLAEALSQDPERPRRILALDYRGRGRSDWDRNWHHYDVRVEATDVLTLLDQAGIRKAVLVGTSRGGLITMALGALRPDLLAGTVLNDVGPVLEAKGLLRIRSYVGKLPSPATLDEAADLLRQVSDGQFPNFTREQWLKQARGTWREDRGRLVLNYDPQLMRTLDAVDPDRTPLPVLWPLFEGLRPYPTLAIRGGLSDLLSEKTFADMQARHPRLTAITVPDQGHAPALEGDLIAPIATLVAEAESAAPATQA